jgi:hypothetical protein
MKFEEALTALRSGAKIRHPMMEPDEYLIGCYVGLNMEIFGLLPENFEEVKARGISITKMKGDRQDPDMKPRLPFREQMDLIDKYPFLQEKLAYPTMNLLLIMSDDWEIK